MSNSGKLALQLRAALRAARPTTKLRAALRGVRLGETCGLHRRGDRPGRGPGQQPGRQRTLRVPGAPGEAGREAGEGRARARGTAGRQGLRAPGTCLGRGSGARSVSVPVCPSPGHGWREGEDRQRCWGTETGPKEAWWSAVVMGLFWGPAAGGGETRQEGTAQSGRRQRPPRRGRGRCVHVRDSVRTVPGPVPVGRACAVCLRPRAGVCLCPRASLLGILPCACARSVP